MAMYCPHCGGELPSIICSQCGKDTWAEAKFCGQCGAPLQIEHDQEEEDFEERILCPDGTCIGTIGPDGRCRVCGLRLEDKVEEEEKKEESEEKEIEDV